MTKATTLSELMAELSTEDRKDVIKRSQAHIKAVLDERERGEIQEDRSPPQLLRN